MASLIISALLLANLSYADFTGCKSFKKGSFTDCGDLSDTTFNAANQNWLPVRIQNVLFRKSNFTGLFHVIYDFSGSDFYLTGWTRSDMRKLHAPNSSWIGADISKVNFSQCNLSNADFSGAKIEHVDFSGCNLSGAKFKDAFISFVKFDGAQLTQADFSGAAIVGSTPANIGNTDGQK